MLKKLLKLPIWKKIILVLLLGVISLIGMFIYGIVTDRPPEFFPLDDIYARYKITKNCPNGQGWEPQTQFYIGHAYCVEYKGDKVLMKEDFQNTQSFTITVGKSNVDLEPFLGKMVENIRGEYDSSSQQCIQGSCVDIGGPFVVLNIDSLEIVEYETQKVVEEFAEDRVKNFTFMGEYDDLTSGEFVHEYKDEYGADYKVDVDTNKVVYFLAYGIDAFPKKLTTQVTAKQAEDIGLIFAQKNIPDYENYIKNATYSFSGETAPKMKVKYYLGWSTKKEDNEGNIRPYHTTIALDQYGNILIFQNEFSDRG